MLNGVYGREKLWEPDMSSRIRRAHELNNQPLIPSGLCYPQAVLLYGMLELLVIGSGYDPPRLSLVSV